MKNIIIHYKSGSCGDFLSIPFIATKKYLSHVSHHELNGDGRMVPTYNEEFLKTFPKQKFVHHYSRRWNDDLENLSTIKQPWLIMCCDINQVHILKNYFQDKVNIITINYSSNYWKIVLQNFCKKVLDYPNYLTQDDVGQNFLNVVAKTPEQRDYFLDLGKNKKLGDWYFQNVVDGNIDYCKEYYNSGDYEIWLQEIYNKKIFFKILKQIDSDINLETFGLIYDTWLAKQNLNLVDPTGLEPVTSRLKAACSTY